MATQPIPTLFELFWEFFKISWWFFGGGYNMIPLLENALITEKNWISKKVFYEFFAAESLLPGSVAVNMASFVGYYKRKMPGLIASTVGVILPSVILVALFSHYIMKYKDHPNVQGGLKGLQAAGLALLAITFLKLVSQVFTATQFRNQLTQFNAKFAMTILLVLFTFVAIYNCEINPIFLLMFSFAFGAFAF